MHRREVEIKREERREGENLRCANDESLVGTEGGAEEVLGRVLVALEPPDGSRLRAGKRAQQAT
jgi:hypothetical protein